MPKSRGGPKSNGGRRRKNEAIGTKQNLQKNNKKL